MESPHVLTEFLTRLSKVFSPRERGIRSAAPQGFTLIEMLVVLAIIIVITAITVVGQTNFNRTLLLTDTAYTVALSIRESQSFGLSSRLFQGYQNAGYGIHFTADSTQNALSYIQFADIVNTPLSIPTGCIVGTIGYPDYKPGNCMYDGAAELVQTYTLGQGFHIANICGILSTGGTKLCSASLAGTTAMDIVFTRPNTGAVITETSAGVEYPASEAIIHITSPQSVGERCVVVTQLGQVSVTSTCP